jgi:hypothetical protein
MKKLLCFLSVTAWLYTTVIAQSEEKENKSGGYRIRRAGKNNSISAGIGIPFSEFSSTHSIGFGIDYSWSNHRYGLINEITVNPVGFTVNVGADYYFGKKETIGPYNYNYSNYTYLHTYGGIIYNPCNKVNISLTAGPALGIYSGHSQFNFGVDLKGSYYLNKNISITPAISFMKESKSDPLWAMAIQAGFSF